MISAIYIIKKLASSILRKHIQGVLLVEGAFNIGLTIANNNLSIIFG